MKATIVLIAYNDAENYGRKLMLEANRHGKMGVEICLEFTLKTENAHPGTYIR